MTALLAAVAVLGILTALVALRAARTATRAVVDAGTARAVADGTARSVDEALRALHTTPPTAPATVQLRTVPAAGEAPATRRIRVADTTRRTTR